VKRARWWESGLNLGFAGTVIAGVVTGIILLALRVIPVWRWIPAFGRWLVRPVPVPLVVLVGIVAALTIFVVRFLARSMDPPAPPWLGYREDSFLGVTWRWQYAGHRLDERSIGAFCPQCQMRLRVDAGGYRTITTTLSCEQCGTRQEIEGNPDELRGRIGRLIEREANIKVRALSE
jgi:hypothetical protein